MRQCSSACAQETPVSALGVDHDPNEYSFKSLAGKHRQVSEWDADNLKRHQMTRWPGRALGEGLRKPEEGKNGYSVKTERGTPSSGPKVGR